MTPFLQDTQDIEEEVKNYPAIVSIKRYPNQMGLSVAMLRLLEGGAKISAFVAQHARCWKVPSYMNGNEKL
jgi:hypothetical protein